MLRAEHPTLEKLILDVISLDYHETLFAAAGHQMKPPARQRRKEQGQVSARGRGRHSDEGRRHLLQDRRPDLAGADSRSRCPAPPRIIALGSCASWGGMPSTPPNPTGSVGRRRSARSQDILSIPGCPSESLQLPCLRRSLPDLRQASAPRQPGPAAVRLQPPHPRELRAPPISTPAASRWSSATKATARVLPVQARLQRPRDLRQLLHRAVRRCGHAVLAGRHGPSCIGCSEKGIGFTKPIHALPTSRTSVRRLDTRASTRKQGTGLNSAGVRGGFRRRGRCLWARARCSPRSSARLKAARNSGENRQE